MEREYYPTDSLPAWLHLNGVTASGVAFQKVGSVENDTDKGNAIVATEAKTSKESDTQPEILLRVPSDLVLSLEAVHGYAKSDEKLRQVLEAVGGFGTTARGSIMIYILFQISHSSPDVPLHIGVSSPWTDYVKFLPSSFSLPTFYSSEELELLRGTSLEIAVGEKAASLEREFEHFRHSTEGINWCQVCWWNKESKMLSMDDWRYLDAAYRSRMVDLPGCGHSMVPCIDMANHVAGPDAKALYDVDSDGNAILQLRWGQSLQPGDEVTISYGDEKSASEILFSYGFLDEDQSEAKQVVLDLSLPDDDPLGVAKNMFCRSTPGLKLSTEHGSDQGASAASSNISWDSPLVWWASVNEEDGLYIGVAQRTDGTKELEATWKGEKVQSPDQLQGLLAADPSWEIFKLRAVVLVLERAETQISQLHQIEQILENLRGNEDLFKTLFRPEVLGLVSRLRKLEGALLQRAIESLIEQRTKLLESETVLAYLTKQSQTEEVEDFS
ncbi:uncharacterized protein N7496_011953 [Penicillium cataractarum]|uniref:SET domain-containing protein n=1 Tax=Penicillium cataractarum TaxID=2100454 RepID=A0A9W9RG13_9EURO|nr:uncharacterized protein N7496_011953 [Penicillium cataractarum]KAJ5359540.1 hypothetical protein N7496_011953 [Penicillium cataractarum]